MNRYIKFYLLIVLILVITTGNLIAVNTENKDLLKIISYANNSKVIAPEVSNYLDIGISKVHSGNIDAINAKVATLKPYEVDTFEEIQALVDNYNTQIHAVMGIITNFLLMGNEKPIDNKLILSPYAINVNINENLIVELAIGMDKISIDNSNIEWEIRDNSIITVDNNRLKAINIGTTELRAKYNDMVSNWISIIVTERGKLLSITIAPKHVSFLKNESTAMTATGSYEDKSKKLLTKYVNWKIIDTGIAYISNEFEIYGLKEGQTEIYAELGSIKSKNATIQVIGSSQNAEVPEIHNLEVTIPENINYNEIIGNIVIENSGGSPIVSFSLQGEGMNNFTIDEAGIIRVSNTANINFEVQKKYLLYVTATNSVGSSLQKEVKINIINMGLVNFRGYFL